MNIGYLMQEGVPDIDTVSGPQLHVKAVITGLQKSGHCIRTILPRGGTLAWSDNLMTPEWHQAAFDFSASPLFRLVEKPLRRVQSELHFPYLNLFESVRFSEAAALALYGCDLVFERYGFLGYGGVLTGKRLGVPLILELNGDIAKELDVLGINMSHTQFAASQYITRRTFEAATGIICVAPVIKERLTSEMGIDPAKIQVIPNGADTDLFSRAHNPEEIRRKFRLAPRPTVTLVSSFQPWHGVELLLDAFCRVMVRTPNLQLLLVGDGKGREIVEERVRREALEDHVRFLGHLDNGNVAQVLSITDVAVAPFPFVATDIVGSPLKIFEYMAAGCPIVASRAPIHDVIEDCVTGLRVPPANASALGGAISCLLSDAALRQRLGTRARQVALENFSWDHTIGQLESFFSRVLAERKTDGLRS